MRYAIVTYSQTPSGKYDEQFILSTKIKNKDLDIATVILDYQDRKVVKMRLPDATTEDRKFDKINDFYKQHYRVQIEEVEELYSIRNKLVEMVADEQDTEEESTAEVQS